MIKLATYSPKEAAELSGVTSDVQREWRRRKLMPFLQARRNSGAQWKTFDLREVCALTIMRTLSELEIPLSTARIIAEASADHVLEFLLDRFDRQHQDLEKDRLSRSQSLALERYVVIGLDKIPHFSDNLEELLLRQHSPATTSLDLRKIADLILSRATKPLAVET